MEVDEVLQKQVSKFQNPNKIEDQNHLFPVGGGGGRLYGWPSSRIVRVSKASGGKDRHSKVLTSKGLRDRRIRLSVSTAIEFYDLQDRLGYDQPSKAVDWLIKAAASSIAELPSLDPCFQDAHQLKQLSNNNNNNNNNDNNNNNNVSLSKSSACSSTSETSKGSGLSQSRSKNRERARKRARDMTAKKEKEKENSSFTDLLTTAINNNSNPAASMESRIHWTTTTTPMNYFQMPLFHQNHHQFSFLQENFEPVVTTTGGLTSGSNRGTLQSNLLSSLPHHHHQLQRFQPASMVDGSTSTNFAFFTSPDSFPVTGYGGGEGGGRHSDQYKGKSRN